MKDNNKEVSVIEQAVIQLQTIVEAADKSAKDKMAKQLPEQFEKLLKEEINKNKKESVQESVKDVTKEPVNEGKKTDGDKESLNEMEEIDLSELSINDIEEAYNEANSSDEFEVSADEINLDDVEAELGEMQNMTADVDSMQQEGDNPNDPFDKIKNLHKMLGEMIQDNEMTNEMKNNGGPDSGNIDQMQGGEITSELIDEAIDPVALQAIGGALGVLVAGGGLAALQNWLKQKNPKAAAALEQLGSASMANKTPAVENVVAESEEVIDEVDEIDDEGKEEVDEKHGVGFSDGKVRAGTLPNQGAEYRDRKGHSRNRPQWSNESVEKFITQKGNMEKRMTSLIKENKNVTKKLNESKTEAKKFAKVSSDQKVLKEALVKYRDQLSEMAVFNTNLASVNNILVNEDLALTADDKKQLITKFKNVKSIDESEKTYKSVLAEMVAVKKPIVESIEEKVSDAIEPSAKVNEQTAYVNEHIDKIKKTMKYVDGHGNSRILS